MCFWPVVDVLDSRWCSHWVWFPLVHTAVGFSQTFLQLTILMHAISIVLPYQYWVKLGKPWTPGIFCLQCCFFKRKKPVKQLKLTFLFCMSLTCCDLCDTRSTPKSSQLFTDFLSLIKKNNNNNTSRYFYGQGYLLGKHKYFHTLVWSIVKSCTDLTVYTLFKRYTFLPGRSFFNF